MDNNTSDSLEALPFTIDSRVKKSTRKHVHKYVRIRLKDYAVYKCVNGGCSHYIQCELSLGNLVICWRCGKELPMSIGMCRMKKPHCPECTKVYTRRKTA